MHIKKKNRLNQRIRRLGGKQPFDWKAIYTDGIQPKLGETKLEKELQRNTDLFKELQVFISTPGIVDKKTEIALLSELNTLLKNLGQWTYLNRKQRRSLDKQYHNFLTTIRLAMRGRTNNE